MLALVASTLASCSSSLAYDWDAAPKNSDGSYNMFALTYNNADPNMSSLWKPGLDAATKNKNGFSKMSWNDAANDDSKALTFLDQALGDDTYDAYAINVVSQQNGATYLDKIAQKGRPVVFFNRELSTSSGDVDMETMNKKTNAYYVGIESAEGGRYEGKAMAEAINEKGFAAVDRNGDGKIGVYVVRGEDAHADAEARSIWAPIYLDAYLDNPNTTDAEITANYKPTAGKFASASGVDGVTFKKITWKGITTAKNTAGATWDAATAATNVEQTLSADTNKDIDVILSNNDGMAVAISNNATFKSSGVLIAGVDALADALQAVKDNPQYVASIRNDGKAQAQIVAKLLQNILNKTATTHKDDAGTELTDAELTAGIKVVTTKEAWNEDPDSIWFDKEHKAFRVHHVIINKSNVNELA